MDLKWIKYFLYIPGTVMIATAITFPFTLIPAHNQFYHPERWYESTLHCIPNPIVSGVLLSNLAGTYMNIDYIKKFRHVSIMACVGMVALFLISPTAYCVWTFVLNYQYPVPFIGILLYLSVTTAILTTL